MNGYERELREIIAQEVRVAIVTDETLCCMCPFDFRKILEVIRGEFDDAESR